MLKEEFEEYVRKTCQEYYETLSDKEKNVIEEEVKEELLNKQFYKTSKTIYQFSLEAKRMLKVEKMIENKMTFEEFCKLSTSAVFSQIND